MAAIENAGVATVDKRSINEGIAHYTSSTCLLQEYLMEDRASVWFVKKNALLDVWLEPIAALLSLEDPYDDKH